MSCNQECARARPWDPFSVPVVTNREERQARRAEGKAKVQALWRGNLGRRLTSEALLEVIELA